MGFLGVGVPLPSRLGDLGERHELPQRRQRILGIFQGLRILLVESMHYGTNQKFGGGAWARFGGPMPPWPQPKTATAENPFSSSSRGVLNFAYTVLL